METMNFGTFQKTIKKNGSLQEVQINPYFNLEGHSSKSVYLSNQVEGIVAVTYRRKQIAIILPERATVRESLQPYFAELQRVIRVSCPVISVFDLRGNKIVQLGEERENHTA